MKNICIYVIVSMCTVIFWPNRTNPRQIFLPPSPPVIRAASSSSEPIAPPGRAEVWRPQTIASKIKYKTAATMMAATMA